MLLIVVDGIWIPSDDDHLIVRVGCEIYLCLPIARDPTVDERLSGIDRDGQRVSRVRSVELVECGLVE
ncbi:hypothetical protein [Halanaeroarchaeum sulfurireducens]|uniref:hypothetical protein n=1 Tax=Halanaeroarchaeum sulfurireducens TaxID=1604004 RepID=UPI00118772BA|nr:hypothetical protein [Halanaeroarchaeum sulfurireducens]